MKYITLGSACCVTHQLIKHNLRVEAYPFDWAKISLTQLLTILENNFLKFCCVYINICALYIIVHELNVTLQIN
jgi:hypothetical protein